MTSSPDIFLSYNREDQTRAKLFADAFQREGFNVWWDVGLRTGEAYDQVTENALRTAKAVVVLWSKRSVESRWVRAEATLADRNKTLVPAMIEACERPIMFELTQTAELSHWQGAADDKAWKSFASDIRKFVSGPRGARASIPPSTTLAEIATEESKTLETTLAVLPFDNLSSDAEMQFFSDGVSEDILSRLARGSKLRVIGKTSSFQFRGGDKPKAASALKATHVLDGSIRRAGNKVRIAAHLTEAASQTTIWSDRYDRGLEDIFAVQDEISEAIAEALNSTFFPKATTAIDSDAYDLYLRAREASGDTTRLGSMLDLLVSATKKAPQFADAWGGLAVARAALMTLRPLSERQAITAAAMSDIAKCRALDPKNPSAYCAEWLLLDPFGAYLEQDDVIAELRATGDTTPEGQFIIGWHLECLGRGREGAEVLRRAYELDPRNQSVATYYGTLLFRVGRYAEAQAILERCHALWPDNHHIAATMVQVYTYLKDWRARDAMLDPAKLERHPLREHEGVAALSHAMQDPSNGISRKLFDNLRQVVVETGHMNLQRLPFAAHAGFSDEMYPLVEDAKLGPSGGPLDIKGPNAYHTHLLFYAAYPELQADPRFVKVAARLGLVEYWLTTQQWPDCADQVPYDFRAECEKYRGFEKDRFLA